MKKTQVDFGNFHTGKEHTQKTRKAKTKTETETKQNKNKKK